MAKQSEFVTYLLEQLAPLGTVTARGMFGGYGVYHGGRMFALVAGDTLYVKVDDTSRAEFESEGLRPFRYERRDIGEAVLDYYEPPAAAIDDREQLCAWAQKGIEAAMRGAKRKIRRKK
jgi:DNA transformation protein